MPKPIKKNAGKTIEPEVSESKQPLEGVSEDDGRIVKLDNKRLEGLDESDAVAIVSGAMKALSSGSINKITIE